MDFFSTINEDAFIRKLFTSIHAKVETLPSGKEKENLIKLIDKVITLFQKINMDTVRVIQKLERICDQMDQFASRDILYDLSLIQASLSRWKGKKPPKKFRPSVSMVNTQMYPVG